MFGVLRSQTKVSIHPKYKELAICAIAVLNNAEYEFFQHERPWVEAGATPLQIRAIRAVSKAEFDNSHFDEMEQLVIRLTIEMTKNIKVDRSLMDSLRSRLTEKELVELVAVISGYNMVSRFLVALDITAEGEI
jgi:alkylhydroperoxidase family enzyme